MAIIYGCVKAEGSAKKEKHKRFSRNFPFIVTVFVESGSYMASFDGKSYIANEGDTLVIPAHILHDITMPQNSTISYSHIFAREMGEDILSFYNIPHIISGERSQNIGQCNTILSQYYSDSSLLSQVMCDNAVSSIISSVLSSEHLSEKNSPEQLWVMGIRMYILKNIKKKITLNDLCEYISMSPSGFSEKFKKLTGYSPINYVIKMKMEYASSALLSGESIKSIVTCLDIYDEAYFSRLFKKHTDKSPREYVADYKKTF